MKVPLRKIGKSDILLEWKEIIKSMDEVNIDYSIIFFSKLCLPKFLVIYICHLYALPRSKC